MSIVVIGGGAAGMMAAVSAAGHGQEVILLEKNEKLGKKLYITGKGRCNLTNACMIDELFDNVITNKKFLYKAFYSFSNMDTMEFFEGIGCHLKTERGKRVFPASDHSSSVIKALSNELKRLGTDIRLNTRVRSIVTYGDKVTGVITDKGDEISLNALILATGGLSYKSCGADNDSWRFADKLKIKTKEGVPSLVPIITEYDAALSLKGLSLKNVRLSVIHGGRKIFEDMGEMLFTHFGLSGPLVLSSSAYIDKSMYDGGLMFVIDLKPALSHKQLDERIRRDLNANINKSFKNSLGMLLPSKLIPYIVSLSGIDPAKKVNEITREERQGLCRLLKELTFTATGDRGFDEAIITRGGIDVKEIDPSSMASKRYKGLYFAGEMIDVDALTGGFNLQIAWSTGYLAGISAAGYAAE